MEDIKKPVCPKCGQAARCFCRRKNVGSSLWHAYVFWCETCRQRKDEKRLAGYRIGDKDFLERTTCPFCGKPPEEHASGLTENEVLALLRQHEQEDCQLCDAVETQNHFEACDTPVPQPVSPTPAPATPKRQSTLVPPPRVKTRRSLMKTWKFLTRWSTMKLMAVFTIVYTLALGTLIFAMKLWDAAPVRVALQETILSTTIVAAWMIICSGLIVRYSRKHYGES